MLHLSQRDNSHYSDNSSFYSEKAKRRKKHRLLRCIVSIYAACRKCIHYSKTKNLNNDDYYEDESNEYPTSCFTFGTAETDGVWMNRQDLVGTCMSAIVWILMLYSAITMAVLSQNHHLNAVLACVYGTLVALALAAHIKTCLTDPGSVPSDAVPYQTIGIPYHNMCSQCQTYKPAASHHCRICNRCISGMDHHCPWMNNCIGTNNLKHFILFLLYTWTACALALLLFAVNYFFCAGIQCEFTQVEQMLVRIMSVLSLGALLFTSSMLMNVIFTILTGATTIDRLKMKATNTWSQSTLPETPLTDIFGIGPWWTRFLPMDPIFDDYDRIMGYATRQRLLRQQFQFGESVQQQPNNNTITAKGPWDHFTPLDV